MNTHTRGPWRIRETQSGNGWFILGDNLILGVVNYDDDDDGIGHEASCMNANLISAAPNLFDSLQELIDISLQAMSSGDWKVDGACDPSAILLRAEKAISKATGEQS